MSKRTIEQLRIHNLRRLVLQSSATEVSQRLGYAQPTYLSQMVGPRANRPLSEKNARKYERKLGLAPGWFDKDHEQPAPPDQNVALLTDVIRLVGDLMKADKVAVQPDKFAEVVALTLPVQEAQRAAHVKSLLKLLRS